MLSLDVDVAVVTNVELDHHATYGSLAELREAFRALLAGAPQAVLWDRPEILALRGDAPTSPSTCPRRRSTATGRASRGAGSACACACPAPTTRATPPRRSRPARWPAPTWRRPPPRWRTSPVPAGASRRSGATRTGARVVDDYAHHPTEVAATIDAARTQGPRRVVAVFQPHLYSRTQRLAREFGAALARADVAAVLDVYPARERAEDFPGVSGLLVAEATADAAGGRTVLWLPTFAVAEPVLASLLRDGDLCLVLGAGDVDALGRRLSRRDSPLIAVSGARATLGGPFPGGRAGDTPRQWMTWTHAPPSARRCARASTLPGLRPHGRRDLGDGRGGRVARRPACDRRRLPRRAHGGARAGASSTRSAGAPPDPARPHAVCRRADRGFAEAQVQRRAR